MTQDPIERIAKLAAYGETMLNAAIDAGLVTKKVTKRRKTRKARKAKAKAEKPKAEKKSKKYPVEQPEAA